VIYQRLGIPTVATVTWTTDQVMRRLFRNTAIDWTDPSGRVSLAERALPEGWAGRKLVSLIDPGKFQVVAVTRAGEARLATPDLVGQEGDILHVVVSKENMDELDTRLAEGADGHAGGH
jgi:trk system potassium uptake protein TrkA